MDPTPKISIVLPTYNGSRYLRQSIQSCLDQTLSDWELIIVDDCSTDETPAIIAEFAAQDSRIRPLRNPVNRKLPGSLNVGFDAARGTYLTWTSDDNAYRPEALATLAGVLDRDPQVGFVYSDMSVIDGDGHTVGLSQWVAPPADLVETCCVGACFLYRRSVMEQVGPYDETLVLVEDYDFWLRASAVTRLEYLRQDLYLYRTHDRSLTATRPGERALRAVATCLSKNLPTLDWSPRSRRSQRLLNLTWIAHCLSETQLSQTCLQQALRLDALGLARRKPKLLAALLLPERVTRRWADRTRQHLIANA